MNQIPVEQRTSSLLCWTSPFDNRLMFLDFRKAILCKIDPFGLIHPEATFLHFMGTERTCQLNSFCMLLPVKLLEFASPVQDRLGQLSFHLPQHRSQALQALAQSTKRSGQSRPQATAMSKQRPGGSNFLTSETILGMMGMATTPF